MPGYVISNLYVHNPEGMAEYRENVTATVEAYGGRYIVRGGAIERLEGDWEPGRLTIIEFESVERARAWYDSDAHQRLIEKRLSASTGDLLIADGLTG